MSKHAATFDVSTLIDRESACIGRFDASRALGWHARSRPELIKRQ